MLVVHHLGISQSDRIVWLCEELGIRYELKRYERDPVTRLAPPEYKALHAFGTAPVISDDGCTLAESGAIIEYIIAKHGHGRLGVNATSPDFADYLFWFHFANGSFMPAGIVEFVIKALGGGGDNETMRGLRKRLDLAFDLAESRLGQSQYFAGAAFTAADIMMMFPLTTMRAFAPRDLGPYPNIRAYLQRIAARPGYRTAMQKADPGFTAPVT